MKKILLLSLFILCISQITSAQTTPGPFTVGINSGMSIITSGGDDTYFHLGGDAIYAVTPSFAAVGSLGYSLSGTVSLLEVTANGRYVFNPAEEYKFFGEVGLGSYTVKVDVLGLISISQSYFGFNLGGGVSKNINDKVGVTAKVKYHNPLTGDDGALNWINAAVGVYVGL